MKLAHTCHQLDEDTFFDRFKPIRNLIDTNAAFGGCMFETFGPELDFVRAQQEDRIWTICDGEDSLVITSGFPPRQPHRLPSQLRKHSS